MTTDKRLPLGWSETRLSMVTSHHSGDSSLIKGRLPSSPGSNLFPAFSASGQDVWSKDFTQQGDAIVVSAVGARCGKCFLTSGKWSAIANTHVIWPECNGIHRRFLWYRINDETFWVRSGSAQPFVVVKASLERPFNLPPLPEQNRIADVLDELFSDLDAGVAALERVRHKRKLYRASVLKAAVEGTLTTDWREEHPDAEPAGELLKRILVERRRRWEEDQLRKFAEKGKTPPRNWKAKYKEPFAPETANLPQLPEGWCWANLGQLAWSAGYGTSIKCRENNRGLAVLRIPNIIGGRVNLNGLKFAPDSYTEQEDRLVSEGDLLVVRTNGSRNLIGRGAVVREEQAIPLSFASYLIRLRLVIEPVLLRWVSLLLESSHVRRWIEANAATSAGQYNISLRVLETLSLPIPLIAEQEAVVDAVEEQLSVIDHLETDIDAKLKTAQGLRQAILKQAFTGKLVPQDPSDEPASELLKRIAAEREARAREAAAAKRATGKPRRRKPPRTGVESSHTA